MNKRAKITFFSILLIAIVLLVCSFFVSNSSPKRIDHTGFYMDTFVNETIYGKDTTEVLDFIGAFDSTVSSYNENSEIYKLNTDGANTVSEDTANLLTIGKQYSLDSKGLFDISLFPVTSLWAIGSDNPKVPTDAEISEALTKVGYENIVIDGTNISLSNNAGIDLGGIAKGYALDKAYELYKNNEDVKGAVLSFGSSILLYGENPKGSFNVAVRNPDNAEASVGILNLSECFISTSGGYERYFEADSVRYSHIFDPKTGRPCNSKFKSVTVITKNGALGDYLSTAVYVGGKPAISLIPDDCYYIIIDNDNKIHISRELSSKFSLTDSTFEVIYE